MNGSDVVRYTTPTVLTVYHTEVTDLEPSDPPQTQTVDNLYLDKDTNSIYLTANGETAGSVKKAVKDASDTINATIGTIAEGKTVVQMIEDAKTTSTYDDTEIRGLIQDNADAIEAHKTAIDGKVTTLVGTDTDKSVRTIANEELAAQLIPENAKESLNTLQEIASWIQNHPDNASAINQAITALQTLVGTIPEDATATDIVNYIKELVDTEKTRTTGVESGLDTRLSAVETKVGEGFEPIPEASIRALFAAKN